MVSQTHFRKGCDQGEDATAPLFVLAGKRRKNKCLFSPNVKISVLFKKNSCRSIDKNAQRLSEVHLSPVLSQLANADQVRRMVRKRRQSENVTQRSNPSLSKSKRDCQNACKSCTGILYKWLVYVHFYRNAYTFQ